MKKLVYSALCLALCMVMVLTATSCGRFGDMEGGTSTSLSDDHVLINPSHNVEKDKDGRVIGVDFAAEVIGYPDELSYFNAEVQVTWIYEVLGEDGAYVEQTFSAVIQLNAGGNGSYEHSITLPEYRAFHFVRMGYNFNGTVVKIK